MFSSPNFPTEKRIESTGSWFSNFGIKNFWKEEKAEEKYETEPTNRMSIQTSVKMCQSKGEDEKLDEEIENELETIEIVEVISQELNDDEI